MSTKHIVLAVLAAIAGLLAPPQQARAYPVDCAILLCLSGGWPPSPVCVHARAVFIERITPFPIEPPLQIWNCPMRAAFIRPWPQPEVWQVAAYADLAAFARSGEGQTWLRNVSDRADIDISDPVYDFVRSIHVFHIRYSKRMTRDGTCRVSSAIERGSYGSQGEFRWQGSTVTEVPKASKFKQPTSCMNYTYRSVFVDWQSPVGGYGKEEVRY